MPRKTRTRVVFDTNVLLRFFFNHYRLSANNRVVKLWLLRRELKLIVSQPVVTEYVEVLQRLQIAERDVDGLRAWLDKLPNVTHVNLGKRHYISRDTDDNVFIDTAETGGAEFIVSNDRDLLDIPPDKLQTVNCEIIEPHRLLSILGKTI